MADQSELTLLLGAGASADAGVPVTKDMTKRVHDELRSRAPLAKALEVSIAGLKFHRSYVGRDPFSEIDVENLYEILVTLGDRRTNFIAPFVGAWSDAVNSVEGTADLRAAARRVTDEMGAAVNDLLDQGARGGRSPSIHLQRVEGALRHALVLSAGGRSNVFHEAASAVLSLLPKFCWITDVERVKYLEPLLGIAPKRRLWIASLNYDNSVELCAKKLGLEVDLGLQKNSASVMFQGGAQISLAKLHGSVDWAFTPDGSINVGTQPGRIPAVIFGTGNKLQIEGPYLDLMLSFRQRLQSSLRLIVCGYSFRDRHINHLILTWIQQSPDRNLLVFDPGLNSERIVENLFSAFGSEQARFGRGFLESQLRVENLSAPDAFAELVRQNARFQQ